MLLLCLIFHKMRVVVVVIIILKRVMFSLFKYLDNIVIFIIY